MTFESIILTLQYCLETFEQSCSCGKCDPCTRGQRDIKAAIEALETVTHRHNQLTAEAPSVRYALERSETRIEFFDRQALVQFVRESMPQDYVLSIDPTTLKLERWQRRGGTRYSNTNRVSVSSQEFC